jgi:radical SAM protein with 4Fe4S-binding SPASM domain
MDVFDYSNHFFHQLAAGHDPTAPVQLELHPGLHCDLYQCPHCYGTGQAVMPGRHVTVEEIDSALAEIEVYRPTVIVSGITTEPLTHPRAAALIRAIKRRNLTLGLYTKGRRLDAETRQALLEDGGQTFITLSLDAVSTHEYTRRHGIRTDRSDSVGGASGADYFAIVLDNLAKLRTERDAAASKTHIRGAFLLFADNASVKTVSSALDVFGPHVDLLRFAIPQDRNDGLPPGELPEGKASLLEHLTQAFHNEPKVKILRSTQVPTRTRAFRRCWAQRFQAVIDKSGNVFPCPQVAVAPFRHLSYGNIRTSSLTQLLGGEKRLGMFRLDVDSEMKCRICDRKDEALNVTLSSLDEAYGRAH